MKLFMLYEGFSKPSEFDSGINPTWPNVGPIIRGRIYDFLQKYTIYNGRPVLEIWQGKDKQKGIWKWGSGTPICSEIPDPNEKGSYFLKCNPALINPDSKIPEDWRPQYYRDTKRSSSACDRLSDLISQRKSLEVYLSQIEDAIKQINDYKGLYGQATSIASRLDTKVGHNILRRNKTLESIDKLNKEIQQLQKLCNTEVDPPAKAAGEEYYSDVTEEDVIIPPPSTDIKQLQGNQDRQKFLINNISKSDLYAITAKYSKSDIARIYSDKFNEQWATTVPQHEIEWLIAHYGIAISPGRKPFKYNPANKIK